MSRHYARDCPVHRPFPPPVDMPAMEPIRPPFGGRGRGRSFGDGCMGRGQPFHPSREEVEEEEINALSLKYFRKNAY